MTRRLRPSLSAELLEGRDVPAAVFGLTAGNALIQIDPTSPTLVDTTPVAVTGLNTGDALVGIDFGPTGLLYGVGNIGLRVMRGFQPVALATDPAAWAALVGGLGGMLVLATALQRGSVALAAGSVTTSETVAPALVGLLVLGERPRPGWALVAAVGFVVAVAGAVVLCRDVETAVEDVPEPATGP